MKKSFKDEKIGHRQLARLASKMYLTAAVPRKEGFFHDI
jgi:hypothetical protein